MIDKAKAQALRFALANVKAEYDTTGNPGDTIVDVLAYLSAKVRAHRTPRIPYAQLSMFAVVGKPNGKYHCCACGEHFGENNVSRLQSKRAYLTLHCPHCMASWFADKSQ